MAKNKIVIILTWTEVLDIEAPDGMHWKKHPAKFDKP
jgi:hypothetical protein